MNKVGKIVRRSALALVLAPVLVMADGVYTGGANANVSLFNGKVQIVSDADGNVTSVVAKPSGGETLAITGDAMTFADGATITIAADPGGIAGGSLVFSNDVTAAGSLALSRTDGAYVVWSDTASPLSSASWRTVVEGGAAQATDWEIVYVCGQSTGSNPAANYFTGPYHLLSHDSAVSTDGSIGYRLFVLNRFWAQKPRTISVRIALGRDSSNNDLKAKLFTIVRGPNNICMPNTDLWTAWYGNMPRDTGLYGIYDSHAIGNNGAEYGGEGANYKLDRLVVRRVGSEASVGFAGAASMSGTVDVGFGVKFAVLPKADSAFVAPVFSGQGDVEYQRNATLASANRMRYSTDLTVTNGATVTVTGTGAFPTNGIVSARNGGILVLNSESSNVRGISDGFAELHACPGGEIRIPKDAASLYNIANGARSCTQEVFVEGGTFWPAYDTEYLADLKWNDARCYLPFLTISNGGRIRGTHALWGNNYPMKWFVAGDGNVTDPAIIDSIWSIPYTGNNVFTIAVHDVTGDDDADLIVNGEIPNYQISDSKYQYYTTAKYGDGTVRINGKWALRGTTTIYGGGIVFGDEGGAFPVGAVNQSRTSAEGKRNFVIANGSMLGKTDGALDLDTLTVTGGGVLDLGETATMTFADSSAKTWTGRLVIKGFREGAVRFGSSAAALTDAQVALIRTGEGKRLHIDDAGYLLPHGMVVIVK